MSKNTLHLYLRVSSAQQEADGYGLETQRKVGVQIAEREGFSYKIHEEGAASSSLEDLSNRPVLSALLEMIEKGEVGRLYVFHADRLSRNDKTSSLIRYTLWKNKVVLYTQGGVTDFTSDQDTLMFGILGQLATYENKLRTNRLRRGRIETVRDGNWHGGDTPFGYRAVDGKLTPFEDEVKWVRKVYEWYADGEKIDTIRLGLMSNGILTRRGKRNWSYNAVRLMLSNTTYDGVRTYTDKALGETVTATCPKIVDPILSMRVREKLAEVELNRNPNRVTYDNLLYGKLVCGNCGGKIGQRVNPKQHRHIYTCKQNERRHRLMGDDARECRASDGSRVRGANVYEADHLVWVAVVKTLSESSLYREVFKQKALDVLTDGQFDETTLKKELKRLDKQIVQLRDYLSKQKILEKLFDDPIQGVRGVTELILETEAKREGVLNTLSRLKEDRKWVDWVGDFNAHIRKLVEDEWSLDEKKSFLDAVVEKIEMTTVNAQEHRFDIQFSLPHDGSRIVYKQGRKGAYDLVMGEKVVTVNTREGLGGLKKKVGR